MHQLKHYTALAYRLQQSAPEKHEVLEEEINIIIHKLKFIPLESRPQVEFVNRTADLIDREYLEEILEIAGAQINPLANSPEQIDILIFKADSMNFLSTLPELINAEYGDYKAVQDNNIFIILKPDFGLQVDNLLPDTEILAEIVQSKYFVYGHEGEQWIRFAL
ncbi:hypothetical protein ACS126_17465 [Sphingobacterium lactis]|uniref:hypothetical protein n=1 Tax=Sphingobacterium lactis TaxID=797291 RepID=UPI003EC7104F